MHCFVFVFAMVTMGTSQSMCVAVPGNGQDSAGMRDV